MLGRSDSLVDIQTVVNTCIAQNLPTVLIDQNIGWLRRIKHDAEFTISQLENVKKERSRMKAYRDKMNSLADLFIEDDTPKNDKIKVIIQRLGCDKKRADQVYELLQRRNRQRHKNDRNKMIAQKHLSGQSVAALHKEYGLSRQQIYNIISSATS